MATQVPYSGTIDQTVQVDPLPQAHVDANPAAFGSSIAGAVTHLGDVTSQVGKELTDRAIAFQTLDEHMRADAATTDAMDKQTSRYLEFSQLKGNDLVQGFGKYKEDLAAIRNDGLNQLQSPYAKDQYLQYTRRSEGAMLFHGGMLAKQGLQEADHVASQGVMDGVSDRLATLGVGAGPDYDKGMGEIKSQAGGFVERQYGVHPGQPGYDQKVQEIVSGHAVKIISSIGKEDGSKAKELLDAGVKSGTIRPVDALKVGPELDSRIENHDARDVGHNVANGSPDYWGTGEKYSGEVSAKGLAASGNGSYSGVGPALPDGSHSVGRYGVNSGLLGKMLPEAGLVDERGQKVTTEADFLNSPKAQNTFSQEGWAKVQSDAKDFKTAYKTWTGEDNPVRYNAALNAVAKGSDPAVIADKSRASMATRAPNSPSAQDNAAEIATNNQYRARRVDDLSAMQDRNEVVNMVNGEGIQSLDGKVPQSLDEALKDPKFAEKYFRLPGDDQQAVLKVLHQNGELGGVRENAVGQRLYEQWKSVAVNRDTSSTPEEIEGLMKINPLQMPWSPQHRMDIVKAQHEVLQGQTANPNMTHAMGLPAVQKLLQDAGVSKASTPDEYNKFTNAYHEALKGYSQGQETPVKRDEDFTKIAQGLIGTKPGLLWGTNVDLKYNDAYTHASEGQKKMVGQAFMQENGRAYDPNNDRDVESLNRITNWMIFNTQGARAKGPAGASKSDQRAQ